MLGSWGGPAWAVNYSLDFDGNDDYVKVTTPALPLLDTSRTVSAWIKPTSAASSVGNILTYGTGDCTGKMWGLGRQTGTLRIWGGCKDWDTGLSIPVNQWSFVAVTYDGTTVTAYVNDNTPATWAASGFATTSSHLFIGAETANNGSSFRGYFKGPIDEVAIWDEALTTSEMTALYNSGTPLSAASDSGSYASSANLAVYYTMDSNSGTGSTLTDDDNGGTDYDGTISGATWTAFSTTQSETTRTITEGGSTSNYTLALDQQPISNVTVTITSDDTGAATVTSSLTFTKDNWNTAQTITVTPVSDDDGTDESVTISHSLSGGGYTGASVTNVIVTVMDDDTQALTLSAASATIGEASSSTYTVKLATQPTGTVTVALASDDTTAATVPSSSLIFTASDWNTAQTVTVTGVNDDDATNESVTISSSASGGDYGSVLSNFTAAMTDDDTVGITQSATSGTISESGTGTYTAVLNTEPTGTVTVTLTSSDIGAATVTGTLTFTTSNWNTAQTIIITGVNDADYDNESIAISHSISGGGYGSVIMTNYTATITDDDSADSTPPTMTITASGASSVADGSTSEDTTLTMIFTSNEATTDFAVGDITATNASLSSFSKTSSTVYTAILTPTKQGAVTVNVSASTFNDAAGNDNTAASEFNWTYLSSPLNKADITASVKAMSGVAIDTVAMNFNAVEHRVAWINSKIGSNKLSHQGIRLKFANPAVDKLMNTAYVKPGKLKLSNEFLKLIRNNIKEGEAPQASTMTDDTKQGLSSVAFNEIAKIREDTIDKVLNATGGSVMGDWNVWTEGRITLGKTYKTDTSSAQDSETQNLSLGFDRVIKDDSNSDANSNSSGHIIGVVLGIGKSDANTTNNSTVDADSYSLSAYGVIRQNDKALVQAMMGYGHIKVDKIRIDGSDTLTGAHDANQFFTSLKVQKETIEVGSFSLSPYGKIRASRTWYDDYSESGGVTAITYGKQTIDSTVLSAGVDVDYLIPIHKGDIRPFMQFEYGADVSGSSPVNMHYNNETTNYQLQLDNKADSNWKFALGADLYTKNEWDSSFIYERTEAVDAGYNDSLAVKVGLKF